MSKENGDSNLSSSLMVLCERLYKEQRSPLSSVSSYQEQYLAETKFISDISNQNDGLVVLSIYFVLFCLVGFAYISSLRYRIQTCRDASASIDLDKQLKIYVYVLPILVYMVLHNISAAKRISQIKCDVCIFGLISGLIVSLYKGPTTRAIKVTVWSNQTKRCAVWIASTSQSLKKVQALIGEALSVQPMGRICFYQEGVHFYARDLSMPFSSLLANELIRRDFFGFSCAACHVCIQSPEAYDDVQALLSDTDAGSGQSPGPGRPSMLRSVSRVFKIKRGDSSSSFNGSENHQGEKGSPGKKGASSWMRFGRNNQKKISEAQDAGYDSDGTNASNITPGTIPRKTSGKFSDAAAVQSPPEREILHIAPQPKKHQIEAYVDAILRDPTMNLPGVPDKLEKKVYSIAINMALRACLKGIFSVNGKMVMGHHIEIEIREGKMPALPTQVAGTELSSVEELVDELLKEEMINITWLPDKYEKPLYVNVIMAVLTVMNSFFAATKVDILGHVMEMKMSPSGHGLRKLADKICTVRRVSEDVLEELLDNHFANAPPNWIPDRLERPMYKTIYALVLCVIDEVFKDMRINFLGDECLLHLVPGPMPLPPGSDQEDFKRRECVAKAAAVAEANEKMVFGRHDLILAGLCGALISTFLIR